MSNVSQVMTRGVRTLAPTDSVLLAAQAMDELNVGSIPVCDGDQLVGMVTDRDITVRGVAQQLSPENTPLSEVMSGRVRYCAEDDDIDDAIREMEKAQIRRLAVVDDKQRLVGILSLGDVAAKDLTADTSTTLKTISTPAEPDRSGTSKAAGAAAGGSASGKPSRKRAA
ncbi:MAG: CBS domain-containing protein [Aquabacterium sp.]|nr:MAG: CBS domain-containing protein [Aquabacterium sp.]